MTTKPNEPEAQKLRDLIAEIAADLSTENPFWTAKLLADALITRGIGIVPAQPVADAGGVTEDDVIGLINIVTDLAEVHALDKAYPEVWGRLDAMVNHAVAAATAAKDAEIARLREALEFYGDKDGWNQTPVKTLDHELLGPAYENQASKVRRDRGAIARAALSEAREAGDSLAAADRV